LDFLSNVIYTLCIIGWFVLAPIVLILANKQADRKRRIVILLIGLLLTIILPFGLAWWADFADYLVMKQYGYDFSASNEFDRYKNVAEQNRGIVRMMNRSRSGIGWPLKAMFFIPISVIYFVLVYFAGTLIVKFLVNRKNNT
jgi:O-antigen ligase